MSQAPGAAPLPLVFRQIGKHLPDWRPGVIFDVGANVGQSCSAYAAAFPEAAIHAFEPVAASFAALRERTEAFPNITVHPVALSWRADQPRMTSLGTSVGNHIVPPGSDAGPGTQLVRAVSGAAIAAELGVAAISFLKIDTEGHDLEVLLGFAPIMPAVDFVQVEAGMNPYNRTHVPFRILEDTLRHFGFLLFNIYEPMQEFKRGGRPVLRRTNPVFINARLVDTRGIA